MLPFIGYSQYAVGALSVRAGLIEAVINDTDQPPGDLTKLFRVTADSTT